MAENIKMARTLLNRRSFPEVNRPGREGNNTPPSSAKDKNEWSYTSTPPARLRGVGRDKLAFIYIYIY